MSHVTEFIKAFIKEKPEGTYSEVKRLYGYAFYGNEPKNGEAIFNMLKNPKPVEEFATPYLDLALAKQRIDRDIQIMAARASRRIKTIVLYKRISNWIK